MKSDGVGSIRLPVAAKADDLQAQGASVAKKTTKSKPADTVEVAKKKPAKGIKTVVFPPLKDPWTAPTKMTVLTEEKSVYDGDTFKGQDSKGRVFSVRVGEINAPERRPAEAGWEDAQKLLEKLVKGKEVELDFGGREDPRDDYGRLVARVHQDGVFVQEKLLEKGVAHAYFVDTDDGFDRAPLIAAQERAKAKGLGIWAQERFQKPFTLTSFHPNGRGNDAWNPNVEYIRICNIASKPLNLAGYTISNAQGTRWTLPDVTVPVGATVQIFSGRGENELSPPKAIKIHLGSKTPIWDNYFDKMTLRDAKDTIILSRDQNQDPPNLEKLASETTITQKQIGRLGSDVDVTYTGPAKVVVKDYIPDDGDTIYIPMLKDGTFKAKIGKWEWALQFSDNDQAPKKGTMGIRFVGVDTPETRVVKVLDSGETIYASQGPTGELAKEATLKMLKKADKIWVVPAKLRPFDVYDRMLGTVMVEIKGKTIDLNKWLVENGHGEMVSYYGKDFDPARHEDYAKASRTAFEEKRGIYGDTEQKQLERPSDFRRRMQDRPPSRDFIADWETKLVYPAENIDMVPPYRRVFILHDDLSPALLDERFGFKLAKIEPQPKKPAPKSSEKPKVRAIDLQVREKAGRKSA